MLHCYFNPSKSIGDKQMATYFDSEKSERELRDTYSAACSVGDGALGGEENEWGRGWVKITGLSQPNIIINMK